MLFWVWNRTIILLARTTRNCPGRMNTSPEQETSIICVTYVRTKGQRYTLRHYNYQVSHEGQALWRSHADARPRLGPAKSHGGGLAGCRCNIDETAVCFVLTRLICVLFFFLRPVSEKSRRRAVGSGATHAYRCIAQHAPRTHCPSRPGGVD